jgi:thiamine biosynthesis protein ThiS
VNIKINGKIESVDRAVNIAELVSSRGLSPAKIVVEHNFNIVSADKWAGTALNENDSVEIVSFVGGG